ncbi:hypothetical protein BaRGS_00034830 [Batillaria attramentaria]|uniref:Uncharacterized protein n=1 Tax=Batillaria attramentaria TaxID=370345 RepID=A0ABD0JGL8_9CAEN
MTRPEPTVSAAQFTDLASPAEPSTARGSCSLPIMSDPEDFADNHLTAYYRAGPRTVPSTGIIVSQRT